MPKIIIDYDPKKGETIRDGELEDWAKKIVAWYNDGTSKTLNLCVANEICIEMTRLQVKKKLINHKDLFFTYSNTHGVDYEIKIDKNGHLNQWPKGFCDYNDNILEGLLGWKDDNITT